jgi:hypothetical protein
LSIIHSASDPQLVAFPTGAGESKVFPKDNVSVFTASFLPPDGKQLVLTGSEPGHGSRLYVRDFAGGKPKAISPEGYFQIGLSAPDGKWTIAVGPDRRRYLYPIAGGEPTPIPGLDPQDAIDQRSADGRYLYVHRRSEFPLKSYRLEIATGKKEPWRTIVPSDPAGVWSLGGAPTPDGESYLYNFIRTLSDLYLVEGVR